MPDSAKSFPIRAAEAGIFGTAKTNRFGVTQKVC